MVLEMFRVMLCCKSGRGPLNEIGKDSSYPEIV